MLEAIDYRTVGKVVSIVCGFVERVNGCTKSLKMMAVHTMYSSSMSTVMYDS